MATATPMPQVCDRTALILDIFMQRAQTKEGKLQVCVCVCVCACVRACVWGRKRKKGGGMCIEVKAS